MSLILNWYTVEGLPAELTFPTLRHDNWQATRPTVDVLRAGKTAYYRFEDEGAAHIVAFGGNRPSQGWDERLYSPDEDEGVFNFILERSLANHLRARGLSVSESKFGVEAFPRNSETQDDLLEALPGISLKAYKPEGEGLYGVTINWKVRVRFKTTLADQRLHKIAHGAAVVLAQRETEREDGPLVGRGRFLGTLTRINSDETANVRCRDGETRPFALAELKLEPNPRTTKQYESAFSGSARSRNLWRAIQQLSKTLDAEGNRNLKVLQDRMRAIHAFLSPDGSTRLQLELATYTPVPFTLKLLPEKVRLAA